MQKDKLYARIGELTVQFATMEHQLQSLLKILLREECPLIGPFFIHELNLSTLLRKIKHIARYRLQDDEALLADLVGAIKRIDGMRELRNLLIHGRWHLDEEDGQYPVRVQDFKMKYEADQWQDLTESRFNEKRLTRLVRKLQGMSNDIDHLVHRLQRRRA